MHSKGNYLKLKPEHIFLFENKPKIKYFDPFSVQTDRIWSNYNYNRSQSPV